MILIISSEQDGHAMEVLKYLKNKNVDVHLLDLSCFPQKSRISIESNNKGEHVYTIIDEGVNIIGGCCGTNPEYIRGIYKIIN